MTQFDLLTAIVKYKETNDWNSLITAVEAYTAASNGAKPIVSGSLPEYNEILYHARNCNDAQFREYWDDVRRQ